MNIPSREDQIAEILENFNFHKVHMVMCALDWEWYIQSEHDFRVPTIEEMRGHAYNLLSSLNEGNTFYCGGFQARNRDGLLSLEFVLTEWSVEVE